MHSEEQDTQVYSRELKYDNDLILSNSCNRPDGGFKKIISDSLQLFEVQNLQDTVVVLKKDVSYPSDYVFVSLASRIYAEKKNILKNSNKLYGEQFDETLGNWQLITVAYNDKKVNGYLGAAYWNPDMQQVIIAHRGTVLNTSTAFGTILTDIKGICLNQHSNQIDSAVTFTYKIISSLKDISQKNVREGRKEPCIQLFFTGHSLGGWLAQITTFTAKYLISAGDHFVKSVNFEETGYHASTLVFDSPGCRSMLERIQSKLVNRCSASLISSLDITSYLSAPNLINTCNPHVGEVFRIFVILSEEEKSLMRESFAGYTRLMHGIEKIKESFNPETGTIFDDEEGNLRIVRVEDWPMLVSGDEVAPIRNKIAWGVKQVTGALLPGWVMIVTEGVYSAFSFAKWHKEFHQELAAFFTLADEYNDYNISDEIARIEIGDNSYRSVRYQVQQLTHDFKNEHSLNAFTQFERQFLDAYKLLEYYQEELPEEFKFKSMFSSLENNQSLREKTMQLFEHCKIKNEMLHSENLQVLIPYIKRVLHFFPEMKGEVERARQNLPIHILRTFYQSASSSYVNSFTETLEFENDILNLGGFLENENKKILLAIQSSIYSGISLVYNTFRKLQSSYTDDKDHIFLSLDVISSLGDSLFIGFLKKIENKYLLVIEWDDALIESRKTKEFLRNLFKVLKENSNIKTILVTELVSDLNDCIINILNTNQLNEHYERKDNIDLKFSDLTHDSQNELLRKPVIFQGKEVALLTIVDGNNLYSTIDSETIFRLVRNEKIEIGKKLQNLGPTEDYYIHRKLLKKIKIRKEIFEVNDLPNDLFVISNCKDEVPSRGFIAIDDAIDRGKFENICKKYVNQFCNFHLLQKKNNEDIIWVGSYGETLSGLRRYIESCERDLEEDEYSTNNTCIDLVDVEDINKFREKFIIVAAEPGMGKTIAITRLGIQTANEKWTIRLNLVDYKDKLEKLDFTDVDNIVTFLCENCTTPNSLTKNLLKSRLKHSGSLVLLLDGFDEITSEGQKNIIDLLKTLKETEIEKVLISTRLYLRDLLENSLSTFAYVFKPFFKNDQELFLKKIWQKSLDKRIREESVNIYIKQLLKFLSDSIGDKERKFMGIPLQMRMVAEAFQEGLEVPLQLVRCLNNEPTFPDNFDILDLYDRFLDVKIRIYFEKIGGRNINLNCVGRKRLLTTGLVDVHERLAFEELFCGIEPDTMKIFFGKHPLSKEIKQEINSVGIFQFLNGRVVFTHRTFAEYFVANFLTKQLNEDENAPTYEATLKFLSKELFEIKNEVIKTFLDYRLAKEEKILIAALRGKSNEISSLGIDESRKIMEVTDALGRNALHYAAQEGHMNVIPLFFKHANHKCDKIGKTPLHYAARYSTGTKAFSILQYPFGDMDSTFIKDMNGCVPLQYAFQQGNWELVIGNSSSSNVTLDDNLFLNSYLGRLQEIKNILESSNSIDVTSVKDNRGNTLLHTAAKKGQTTVIKFLMEKGIDVNVANNNGERPINFAAESSRWDAVEILLRNHADFDYLNDDQITLLLSFVPKSAYDFLRPFYESYYSRY